MQTTGRSNSGGVLLSALLGVALLGVPVAALGQSSAPSQLWLQRGTFSKVEVKRVERYNDGINGWVAHLYPLSNHLQTIHSAKFYVNGEEVKPEFAWTREGEARVAYFKVETTGPTVVTFLCEATLIASRLRSGQSPTQPWVLSTEEREKALQPSGVENFDKPEARAFLQTNNLVKGKEETDLAFAQRVAYWFGHRMKYLDAQPKSDAVGVWTNGGGQCNQLNAAFTAIMKASGVPSRCYPGYLGAPHDSDVVGHMNSEIWLEGVGWVSTDAVRFAANPKGWEQVGVQTDPILVLGVGALTTFELPNRHVVGGFNWRHFHVSSPQRLNPDVQRNLTRVLAGGGS